MNKKEIEKIKETIKKFLSITKRNNYSSDINSMKYKIEDTIRDVNKLKKDFNDVNLFFIDRLNSHNTNIINNNKNNKKEIDELNIELNKVKKDNIKLKEEIKKKFQQSV